MAAHPLPLSGPLQNAIVPATSAKRSFRGLHLVTSLAAESQAPAADTLTQARRIVAQVEWEIQQQANRERAYRMNRWHAPVAVSAGRTRSGFFDKLLELAGL